MDPRSGMLGKGNAMLPSPCTAITTQSLATIIQGRLCEVLVGSRLVKGFRHRSFPTPRSFRLCSFERGEGSFPSPRPLRARGHSCGFLALGQVVNRVIADALLCCSPRSRCKHAHLFHHLMLRPSSLPKPCSMSCKSHVRVGPPCCKRNGTMRQPFRPFLTKKLRLRQLLSCLPQSSTYLSSTRLLGKPRVL